MQRRIIQHGAQPGAERFQLVNDVRLIEIVSEQIHRDRGIGKAFAKQIKNHLASVKPEPFILRLKRLRVVVKALR